MKPEVKVSNEQIEDAVGLYMSSRGDSNNKMPESIQEPTEQAKPESAPNTTDPSRQLKVGRRAIELSSGEISKLLE